MVMKVWYGRGAFDVVDVTDCSGVEVCCPVREMNTPLEPLMV